LDIRRGELQLDGASVLCRPKGWQRRPRPRTVAPPGAVVAALKAHRAAQLEARLHAGTAWQDHALVFCQVDGRPIDPRQDWAAWGQVLSAAGLSKARVHVMRHTTGTVLLDLGEDLSIVQEVLGHAYIRTTRGYQDVGVEMTKRAADRMNRGLLSRLLSPILSLCGSVGGHEIAPQVL
jgi:site-specific recombinase XerD